MNGGDLLREAVAELYSCDPGEFIERRGVLVARARAAGEAALAKRIAGLRKPTRSAWVLNQLVRSAPAVISQLAALGDELRAAQRSLDGAAIRELSVRRRQLISALAVQAFTVSGQESPSAALKDEVTATLGAALADPQFAGQLRAGALDRAVRRDGFGPAAATVLPSFPGRSRAPAAQGVAAAPVTPAAKVTALADARDRAARERRRQAIEAAEQAVAEAEEAAGAAAETEREHDSAVRLIEEQLAEARQRLADARLQARRAITGQHRARQALDRLREHPSRASARPAKP